MHTDNATVAYKELDESGEMSTCEPYDENIIKTCGLMQGYNGRLFWKRANSLRGVRETHPTLWM